MPTICCNLHSSVVHNHVVELDAGVEAGNLLTGTKEEPVPELHDVGLVDGCHLGIKIEILWRNYEMKFRASDNRPLNMIYVTKSCGEQDL